jgi:hypothetical protein
MNYRKYLVVAVGLMLGLIFAARGYAPVPHSTTTVVQEQFLNQTVPIPSTVLFSPNNDNDFRVNIYISASCGSDAGGEALWVDWNDGLSSNQFGNSVACSPDSSGYNQWSLIIHTAAGSSISFFTNAGNVTYNAYITVERL